MDIIRVGMIGAGSISECHLPCFQGKQDACVTAIADINLGQARSQAEKYGISFATADYHELIEREDVDAVIVGIPTRFHPEAVFAAAKAGKHILCEKPLARAMVECDAMIRAVEEAGSVFSMAFVERYNPEWLKIRELVQSGAVGRPCMWRRIVVGCPPQPPYGAWYSDASMSDGPLTESGSHDFDFVRYTFGDVKSVTASVRRYGRIGDVDDTGTVILDFKSGDQMLCLWSWALPPGASAGMGGLDVIGPEGAVLSARKSEDGQLYYPVSKAGGVEEYPFGPVWTPDTWYCGQIKNFLASIRGRETPRATAEDGRKAQEIYHAAVESSRTGRRVDLE
ncbi:MAG: Gfo/Idh/MocA family oxidoreductase [Armatimonadetes bacterium]|nr:Gfo/Idh/MocA family oxidoreductase [Armatimonadota bacterium]